MSGPKYPKPCIPYEKLESLAEFYSAAAVIKDDPDLLKLWKETVELKGWLAKGANTDAPAWRVLAWSRVKQLLDKAVADGDSYPFDAFCSMWQCITPQIKNRSEAKGQGERNIWLRRDFDRQHGSGEALARSIEELLPMDTDCIPHAPSKLKLINTIIALQKRYGRAPTRGEITIKSNIHKSKVTEWSKEFGLDDLLSRDRAPKGGSS